MAGQEDFFTALKMFKEGVKELQLSRTIAGANEEMQAIRTSEASEQEKRAASYQLAQRIANQMIGQGAPATSAAIVQQNLAPRSYSSAGEMFMEGTLSGDQGLIQQGQQIQAQLGAPKAAADQADRDFQAKQAGLNRASAERIAGIRTQGKAAGTPLTQGQIDNIQQFDTEHIAAQSILEQVTSKPSLVGIKFKVPGIETARSLTDPEFDSFRSEVERWFDAYRVRVTGAGASPGELALMRKNLPKVSDPAENFQKKLQTIIEIGEKVRQRYISNLERGKRDVSGFKSSASNSESTSAQGTAGSPSAGPIDPNQFYK